MSSIILRSATRYLFPILLLFSFFLLLRGHNEPGGGFIGGLMAATAFALYAIAYDVSSARRLLRFGERRIIAVGLLTAAGSGMVGLLRNEPYFTSVWVQAYVRGFGDMHVGTPLMFDVGVYLVVLGVVLMMVFALAEEE